MTPPTDAQLLSESVAIAEAANKSETTGETIEVVSDAPAESASSVSLDRKTLKFRSHTQPSDLLRQVPGLVVSQHAGGGKSDQYFIRGFDADHGTDIAIFADGVPVNLTWAHATFVANRGNGGALALAPRWMGSGGITIHDKRGFVAVRTRGIGDRPGNDEGTLTADGYLVFDVMAGTQIRKMDLNLTVNNALDAQWREAQFAETSRVSPTSPLVEQIHFTPGMPLTATVTAAYRF